MAKKVKNKFKKQAIIYLVLMTVLLIITICLLVKCLNKTSPYYKLTPRGENIIKNKSVNPNFDTVAWIKVQGTNIDYPVIYAKDYTYLNKIVDNFAWVLNEPQGHTNKVTIYGHNLKNISTTPLITDKNHNRFEQLLSFIYYEFAKDNKYIQYTINNKDYLYKIYGVYIQDNNDRFLTKDYTSSEKEEYIKESQKKSFYDYDVEVNKDDDLLTLITCTRVTEDSATSNLVIDARLVRDEENISNYSVNKNEKYKDIEKIIGGKNYEEA